MAQAVEGLTFAAEAGQARRVSRRTIDLMISWSGAVVAIALIALGAAAILFSEQLPASVDAVMERFVGATLIALGLYVGVALIPFLAGLLASLLSVRVVLGIEIVFGVVVVAMALWLPHLLSGEQQAIRAVAVEPGARA